MDNAGNASTLLQSTLLAGQSAVLLIDERLTEVNPSFLGHSFGEVRTMAVPIILMTNGSTKANANAPGCSVIAKPNPGYGSARDDHSPDPIAIEADDFARPRERGDSQGEVAVGGNSCFASRGQSNQPESRRQDAQAVGLRGRSRCRRRRGDRQTQNTSTSTSY